MEVLYDCVYATVWGVCVYTSMGVIKNEGYNEK